MNKTTRKYICQIKFCTIFCFNPNVEKNIQRHACNRFQFLFEEYGIDCVRLELSEKMLLRSAKLMG